MDKKRRPIVLPPGGGRIYNMGSIQSVFKADGPETNNTYSISEWWIEPQRRGPGKHKHEEDDIFFVIEGTMSFYVDDHWIDAPVGTFVLVPAGIDHDFENRGTKRAGILNFSVPGGFEKNMPMIVDWFGKHPPAKTD